MKKTILILAVMLLSAMAMNEAQATRLHGAKGRAQTALNSRATADSIISATSEGAERVREKINDALDDTITGSEGAYISIGRDTEMTAEDVKAISERWSFTVEFIAMAAAWCVFGLALVILLFRYLTRRRKYHMMETAIVNNYPLQDIALGESQRNAIYVQQPVVAAPAAQAAPTAENNATPTGTPVVVGAMPNWRALTPAIKWLGWGMVLLVFGMMENASPFTACGFALVFVGVCKGYVHYKEQQTLEEAWRRATAKQEQQQAAPMREGIPVPPPMSANDSTAANN